MSFLRLSLAATLAALPLHPQTPSIRITYLANEGVILEGRGDLDGTTSTTLQVGEANGAPRNSPALGLRDSLDVVLVPFWYALDDEAFRELIDVLAPRMVVLLHVPVGSRSGSSDERDGWETRRREVRARYQQVRTPTVPGEVLSSGPEG